MVNLFKKKIDEIGKRYDEEVGMIFIDNSNNSGPGYHTRLSGIIHPTLQSASYAAAVLSTGDEELYPRAFRIIENIIALQDIKEGSKTFGLWSYYMEEDLEHMLTPDYNWSDFIGRQFINILKNHSDKLSVKLLNKIKQSLNNAVLCSIKRNVAPDYTNISLMSAFVVISAGEILCNQDFLVRGKKRLDKIIEYTRFNGDFSEYNSSCYTLVAIEEISRMIAYFSDIECIKIARELNCIVWDSFAKHYHLKLKQLSPPQVRAYKELDDGALECFVYVGTQGQYGSMESEMFNFEWLILPINCPEHIRGYFAEEYSERWINDTYYKKNSIRTADESTVTIQDLDSPDLVAFTYMTKNYTMGAFEKTDFWNQRRTSMICWSNNENVSYMRLRCLKNDYDCSAGMAYTSQYKNLMLTNLGFTKDHGDFHYILDPLKDGKLNAEKLLFRFEIGGNIENIKIERKSNVFEITDDKIFITLNIHKAVFDGNEMEVLLHETPENKYIDIVCFDGSNHEIDFNTIESYCVLSIVVGNERIQYNCEYKKEDGFLNSELICGNEILRVKSFSKAMLYNDAIMQSKTEHEQII